MLKPLEFFRYTLDKCVRVNDDYITLCPGQTKRLDEIGIGNYCYFILKSLTGRDEVVKYDHTDNYKERNKPDTIAVQRDILNTGRKAFGAGDCIVHEWFGEYIKQWIEQEIPL